MSHVFWRQPIVVIIENKLNQFWDANYSIISELANNWFPHKFDYWMTLNISFSASKIDGL